MTEPGTLDIEELKRRMRSAGVWDTCDALSRNYHLTHEQNRLARAAVQAMPMLIAEVKRLRAELIDALDDNRLELEALRQKEFLKREALRHD